MKSSGLNDVISIKQLHQDWMASSASNNVIRTEWRHQQQITSSGLNDVINASNIIIRTEWRNLHRQKDWMTSSAHQITSSWMNDVIRKLCGGLFAVCPWSAVWAWRRYTRGSRWTRPCSDPPYPGPGPPAKPAARPVKHTKTHKKKCSVSDFKKNQWWSGSVTFWDGDGSMNPYTLDHRFGSCPFLHWF